MTTPNIGDRVHVNAGTIESPDWRPATVVHRNMARGKDDQGKETGELVVASLNLTAHDQAGNTYPVRFVEEGEGHEQWRWPPRV